MVKNNYELTTMRGRRIPTFLLFSLLFSFNFITPNSETINITIYNKEEVSSNVSDKLVDGSLAEMSDEYRKQCAPKPVSTNPLNPIKHIFIIWIENRSFDNLYGLFAGANGIAESNFNTQVDQNGVPFVTLPPVFHNDNLTTPSVDTRFPTNLPNQPFEIDLYASINQTTPTPSNLYYDMILSINNGKNDSWITYCGLPHPGYPGPNTTPYNTNGVGGSIAFGYYNTAQLPLASLAKEFTLCDNNFQSQYGGSAPNAVFFVSGQVQHWDTSVQPIPVSKQCISTPVPFKVVPGSSVTRSDTPGLGVVDPAGVWIANNATNNQLPPFQSPNNIPGFTTPTWGDQLDSIGVPWSLYYDGVNAMKAGTLRVNGVPFAYFNNYAIGTPGFDLHIKDNTQFLADLNAGVLPSVVVHKSDSDEHPGDFLLASPPLIQGENNTFALIEAIRNSKYWNDCVIFVAWDEGGGFWDHANPPAVAADGYGPGPRTPILVISPFAKRNFVDHTFYENCSLMKFIERVYKLPFLTPRLQDPTLGDLTNALNMQGGQLVANFN